MRKQLPEETKSKAMCPFRCSWGLLQDESERAEQRLL